MSVLIEAISVVVRRTSIETKIHGGWQAFVNSVPNNTLCADGELARVGFMTPVDVQSYVEDLEAMGLTYLQGGKAQDMVVADQQQGLAVICDWAEVGRITGGESSHNSVMACQAIGSTTKTIFYPDGWRYEGSISHTFVYAPSEHVDKSLKFLRREDGLDVYLNTMTGEECYVGRTDGR